LNSFIDLIFSFLVFWGFQEYWPEILASLQKIWKLFACNFSVATSSLKESAFDQDFPRLVNVCIFILLDLLYHGPNFSEILKFFFNFDRLDE
jgi:hypothetical protein